MNNLWRVAKLLPIGGALWYLKDPIRRQRVLDFDFKQNEVLRAPAGIDMGKGHEEPSVHVKLIKTSPLILSVLRDSPLSSLNMGSNDDPRLLDQEPIDPMVPIEEVFPPPVRENEDDRVFEDEPHFGPTAPMEDELDDSVAEGAGVGAARTGGQGASLAEAVDECSPENKPSTSKVSPDTDDEASASEDPNERILTRKRGRRNSPTDLIGNPRQNLEARESDDDESSGPE